MDEKYDRSEFLKAMGALALTASTLGGLLSASRSSGAVTVGIMDTTAQIALTASQAVAAIAAGQLSAAAYVTTLLTRARELADLNTLISLNADAALVAAQEIDAARAAGRPLPPLAGLPIVVKDNINTRDLPTSAGTPALQHFRPNANAATLQLLLDAGAIIIGKANMHELAFGMTSTNFSAFAGAVKNPYNPAFIPGGSSGGTAAAIAARIVPAGLGTDTGGSGRVPAALTGIVGFRPSVGNGGTERRYSSAGTLPISHTRDTVTPMGRTVRDVALLDSVLAGTPVATPVALKGLRFGVPAAFWTGLDHDVEAVMRQAKARLAAAGVVLVDVDMAGVMALDDKVGSTLAAHELLTDIPAYLKASGAADVTLAGIVAQIASPDVKALFTMIMPDGFAAVYPDVINIHRPALRAMYDRYFSANRVDAIFFPTTPLAAVAIDLTRGSSTVSINGGPEINEFSAYIQNVSPASNAGGPGLALPAGRMPGGLPVGMEIDGPVGSDSKLLGIGLAMEALFGVLAPPLI